jgi:hypothetical protein
MQGDLTQRSDYICFSNGLFNLETKELIPHTIAYTPEVFCTYNLRFPLFRGRVP